MWGVPVPINVQDRVGDLVTGEQAFALVEAVNSLDVGALQDRYSNYSLFQVCHEFDVLIDPGPQLVAYARCQKAPVEEGKDRF